MNPPPPDQPDPDPSQAPSEFAKALEEYGQSTHREAVSARVPAEIVVGVKVRGQVVAVGDEYTLIDFGGRSEAVAETRHFRNEDGTLGIATCDTLDLFAVEGGDQIMLAPSISSCPHAAQRHVLGS